MPLRFSKGDGNADQTHRDFREYCTSVLLAARQAIRVKPGAVPVAARHTVEMETGTVFVAASKSLWMKPRSACVSSGAPSFLNPVSYVVGLGSEEQMGRVTAGRVVAAMEDAEPGRNRTVVQFPSDTMRAEQRAALFGLDDSISIRVRSALPRPAVVRSMAIDSGPKALDKRHRLSSALADVRVFVSHSILRDRVVRGRSRGRTLAGPVYFSAAGRRVGTGLL